MIDYDKIDDIIHREKLKRKVLFNTQNKDDIQY